MLRRAARCATTAAVRASATSTTTVGAGVNTAGNSSPEWACTELLSFRRAAGYRQASKDELLSGADIDAKAVPVYVMPNVVSAEEERALLRFTDGIFAPLSFADGHYDNLIEHYKEFYRKWPMLTISMIQESIEDVEQQQQQQKRHGPAATMQQQQQQHPQPSAMEDGVRCAAALARVRDAAQSFVTVPLQDRVHLLQLEPHGFIKAHADESRNSSAVVAGLTLGSGRVMSLTLPQQGIAGPCIDMLLAPRSLYVLAGEARNTWFHSVDAESDHPICPEPGSPVMFDGRDTGIRRSRRTAVIFRGLAPMELFLHRMADKKKRR